MSDILDFSTAWEIQRKGGIKHHPNCSSVPGWDKISGPHFLCDCGAVQREWESMKELDADILREDREERQRLAKEYE